MASELPKLYPRITDFGLDGFAAGGGAPGVVSDYYIQNASFLKIDNITLGYNVDKFIKSSWNARFYATVQNPIIITKYDGLDPEVNDGMDNNVYPRPITVLFGVNINF